MKEIHISEKISQHRFKKGVRQEELAQYMGVSKAAVSKWENGQSYPDITLLPQLAAYFNISIDELIGYEPQMVKEDIAKLYHKLAKDFTVKPFEEMMDTCDAIIKKYYSCFPLLLQMALLLINHAMLSDDPMKIIEKSSELAKRVKCNSDDTRIAREAAIIEAGCYNMMGRLPESLALQDESLPPMSQETELLAQTYQMMGETQKSNRAWQIAIYQHLVTMLGDLSCYLTNIREDKAANEIISRTMALINIFHIDSLHPFAASMFCFSAAQNFCTRQRTDKALSMLEKYTQLCLNHMRPYALHGDEFFPAVDDWFSGFAIGSAPPRDQELIEKSLVQSVTESPAFAILKEEPRYKTIEKKLKDWLAQ